MTYDNSTGTITVNNEVVTPITGVDATHYGSYSVISSDDFLFRYGSNNSGYYMQVIGVDYNGSTVLSGGSFTATISGGYLVATFAGDNPTIKTLSFTEFYGIVPSEDAAVMKASASAVYIKGDSELYASGLTTISAWQNAFHFEGTYDDGITISSPNVPGATYDNIKWNIEAVDGYVDLYKLTSIEFDITASDTTVHATYSYFAVPSEVTAELSEHLDAGSIAVLAALPVLMIAALVIFAVRIIAVRD